MTKEENIKALEELLIYYKKKYYKGEPAVSDTFYDETEEQLRKLAPNSKVLEMVGAPWEE